jgi:hypothetical protein
VDTFELLYVETAEFGDPFECGAEFAGVTTAGLAIGIIVLTG